MCIRASVGAGHEEGEDMKLDRHLGRVAVIGAAAVLAVSALAGCGSSSTASSTSAAVSDADLARLAKGYEGTVPASGPKADAGASVWWVSCGQSIPDCSDPAAAAQAAAKTLGMDFHIADGKLNAGGGDAAAMRTAIAANPDAIIVHGMSCSAIKQPLEEAKAAGIPVMGVEGLDCSDEPGGGPSLFTVDMQYSAKAPSAVEYFKSWGKSAADYIIAATGGQAKVIDNAGNEPLQTLINDGFVEELKTCSGCSIVDTVRFGSPDLIPNGPWVSQFQASMAKNPTANATFLPFDAMLSLAGGVQAVKASGLDMVVAGGSGGSVGMDLVRSGDMDAVTAAHDVSWLGYGAVDEINRVLQGEKTVPEGVGVVMVDKSHNLPTSQGQSYTSSTDWKGAYDKLWGAS
jgi:ribose transport system substrate-binding protein